MKLATGTRGTRHNHSLIRILTRIHTWAYKLTGGIVGGLLSGAPQLLLTTTGRKSGRRFTTPLLCLPDGPDLIVVASYGGQAIAPQWARNLAVDPRGRVQVGHHHWDVRAEEVDPADHQRLWPVFCRYYPGYVDYQAKTDRPIPLIRLRPV